MKNILIFGDSYSTYEGSIPDGFAFYYCEKGRVDAPAVTKMKLSETWWSRLIEKINGNLLQNNSWSGSTIGYTGYEQSDCSKSSSFICRYRKLKEESFFVENTVDTVFVFGGTNDSWSDAPLGVIKCSDWKEQDLFNVLPAIFHFLWALKTGLPNAEIVVIINSDIKSEIQNALETAAKLYNMKYVRLHNIDKDWGHPTAQGMAQISEQILEKIV